MITRFKILIFNMTMILLVSRTPEAIPGGGGAASNVAFPFAPPPSPPPLPETELIFADQRLALVFPIIQKFKNLIISDPFNVTATWTGADICSYRGFFCESPPDNQSATALASIDFNGFHLAAPTLAGFLDQLPDIAVFHANSNSFAGTLSPATAALPYLYELDISNNRFSGPFPASILAMETIAYLDIRFNSFSGPIPPQLFTRNLDALFINNNDFQTRLPDAIANNHIYFLTLANNRIFGPIPRGIPRALSNIAEIVLLNNQLSGCLPYEIGLLKQAVIFDAGNNYLTGPLPFSMGCLENLEILNLAGNLLYGSVPDVVCSLGKVVNLSLADNYFTHVGPSCWRLIRNRALDVKNNCIPGFQFQRPVAECAAFFARASYCSNWPTRAPIPCRNPHFEASALDLPELGPSPS